ncbi:MULTISPECIES: hypothetical protein [unclassified Streptomyces]|uniref:hypothetical protein n=1 Tax=unclassified Streptomyces TaxID=2593676 RepID=UPI0004C846BA|nr:MULTISPECIES: hypothetical protein [unclassified Streptomyces]MCI3930177.1 hypothetical protein [Streptomyces sp. AN091965]
MQTKPIDTARLGVMRCVIAPEARMTPDGAVRRDREGRTLWTTGISVRQRETRRADVITVVTSVQPQGVKEGAEVKITDLWANEWAMDGRSGTTWRAEAITPVSAGGPSGGGSGGSVRGGKSGGGES